MIPMIDDFKQRFTLGADFVVVADSGLMNKNNVALLQEAGYKYILGARIKNEGASVKQWILSLEKKDKTSYEHKRQNGERLIVSYSEKRAKKEAYNRDRGIARLRKAYKSGHITKQQVNKRGYNKFLEISKDIERDKRMSEGENAVMKKIKETGICHKGNAAKKKMSLKQKGKRIFAIALSFLMVNSVIDYPGAVLANAAEEYEQYHGFDMTMM